MNEENKESIEQYNKEIASLVKSAFIMRIVGYVVLAVAVILFIVGTILIYRNLDNEEKLTYSYLVVELGSVFFSASIALFVVRIAVFNTKIRNRLIRIEYLVQTQNINNNQPPIDNDPKYSQKDLDLVNEYKKLLDQGLITEEDFDKKKKEILGE